LANIFSIVTADRSPIGTSFGQSNWNPKQRTYWSTNWASDTAAVFYTFRYADINSFSPTIGFSYRRTNQRTVQPAHWGA
jgi:hypothetical protein